jgi:hypothetical protein
MSKRVEDFIIRIVEERDECKTKADQLEERIDALVSTSKKYKSDIDEMCKELGTTYVGWLSERINKATWDAVVPVKIEKEEQENV